MKITILGAGALAIALAKLFEKDDVQVTLWTKFEEEKNLLEEKRENTKLFPGVKIADTCIVTCNIESAILDAEIIINVLPFVAVKEVAEKIKGIYNKNQIILNATKGLDDENFLVPTEIFEQVLGATKVAALSGPSFAIEIANGDNISFMLGSKDKETLGVLANLLKREHIRIELTEDVKGIQLAGGIKNAIAIGAGMLDGLNAADSTKAAFLASGITDMSHVISKLGGEIETTYSYAGVGDLILTCTSNKSRNHTFGYYIGKRYTVQETFEKMGTKTVEGYKIISTLYSLMKKENIEFITIPTLYNIIFENGDINSIKKI